MTSKVEAQAFVVGGMSVVGLLAAGNALAEGHPPAARQVIGYAGACVGLGAIALWSPDVAKSLTGLIVVATAFTQSDALWSAIVKVTSAPAGVRSSSARRAAPTEGLAA